ncbi:MAG: GYD domain-containing protein [Pseudorhodobacter sp.]
MPMYLFQLSYTADAAKAMITSPSDRKAAATDLINALGGKLHAMYFSFGEYDAVCLIEGPDDKMMAAGAMAVGSSGAISKTHTTKLMSSDEAMAAMAMAGKAVGAYRPPAG